MKTSLENKSTIDDIKNRFDNDVTRFTNLKTGQQAVIDALLMMEVITVAAVTCCPNAKTVLDIGCGAGNNTLKLLEKINPLDCDLVDLSSQMLKKAKERISAVESGKIRLFQSDFRTAELSNETYDIILAAAVLHHLRDDEDWENGFRKIYDLTVHGGCVWITDIVTHENNVIHELMWKRYAEYLDGLGGVEYRTKVFEHIDVEDSPRPLTYQLELLKKVGFRHIEVLHKNSCFAAYGATK